MTALMLVWRLLWWLYVATLFAVLAGSLGYLAWLAVSAAVRGFERARSGRSLRAWGRDWWHARKWRRQIDREWMRRSDLSPAKERR